MELNLCGMDCERMRLTGSANVVATGLMHIYVAGLKDIVGTMP